MKKFLKLLNIKNWIETFVGRLILNKGVKHAVTMITGLILGAKTQPLLTQYGVTIDAAKLQTELTILFGGLAGALLNWGQKAMHKDGEVKAE